VFVVFETKSSFFALINQFLLFFLFLSIIKQNKKIIGRRKHSSLKKKKISASHKAREEGAKSIHNPEAKNARKRKGSSFFTDTTLFFYRIRSRESTFSHPKLLRDFDSIVK